MNIDPVFEWLNGYDFKFWQIALLTFGSILIVRANAIIKSGGRFLNERHRINKEAELDWNKFDRQISISIEKKNHKREKKG